MQKWQKHKYSNKLNVALFVNDVYTFATRIYDGSAPQTGIFRVYNNIYYFIFWWVKFCYFTIKAQYVHTPG